MPLSTGTQLDRKINGGLPIGSVSTFISPPSSNSERFLHQIIQNNTDMQCIYFSTEKSSVVLKKIFANSEILHDTPEIVDFTNKSRKISSMKDKIDKLPTENVILVIDSIDLLEENEGEFLQLLNDISSYAMKNDGIVILNGSHTDSKQRDITNKLSDGVFEFYLHKDSGDIEMFLDVTKFRNGDFIDERIKIRLGREEVTTDTSRAIS